VGLRIKGSRVTAVVTSTREVEADVVVLAMGPWSNQGASWAGKKIPIVVQREQCLRVDVPRRLPPYRLSTGDVAIIPKVNGTVVIGRAFLHDDVVDYDDRPTDEARNRLTNAAVGLVPRLSEARLLEHRAGLEGWPPTGARPILGRLPGFDNLYIAAGMGTLGIMMSPAVGRIMADLIVKGRIEKGLEALSPARFE
jgi:glycine oxidase